MYYLTFHQFCMQILNMLIHYFLIHLQNQLIYDVFLIQFNEVMQLYNEDCLISLLIIMYYFK